MIPRPYIGSDPVVALKRLNEFKSVYGLKQGLAYFEYEAEREKKLQAYDQLCSLARFSGCWLLAAGIASVLVFVGIENLAAHF